MYLLLFLSRSVSRLFHIVEITSKLYAYRGHDTGETVESECNATKSMDKGDGEWKRVGCTVRVPEKRDPVKGTAIARRVR